ncbi:uncharacterized protein LOC108048968 [Drosophila rhopaloa]|uniref:Uncharacterized protein LOC108048968 n=1 Tax=Drosophila rhopaloa TaxID=1041015 RepID=A0A6P4F527_DRORH|nr:uncharacterized protein LOC108048968 [Drosophila rhopaloa]
MFRCRKRINVYVPPISSFPEYSLLGGYGLQDRIELPKSTEVLEDVLGEREPHFLYVIDGRGRLLEQMRFYGDDYRLALRESFAQKDPIHPDNGAVVVSPSMDPLSENPPIKSTESVAFHH